VKALTRPEAVERLERYGISGTDVYLLDLVPLIEMMWADGLLQGPERELFERFMLDHVAAINAFAGTEVLSVPQAQRFAARFFNARPDDRLMQELRHLVPPLRLQSSDVAGNEARRRAIIEWCLDIGAACVTGYPYGSRERFKDAEKERFLAILAALSQPT
jgi:hypothetical protein